MHRLLSGAATAAALACLAAPAASSAAGQPTLPLAEVQAGMQCTVLSVVSGLEPTTFNATILGVDGGPRPSDAMIVARFSGDAIASSGIGQGFSGSPVSCTGADGVSRVIGAIYAGIGQYDNFVGGIRPIEAMLATPTMGDAPGAAPVGEPSPTTPAAPASSKAAKGKKVRAKKTATAQRRITWGAGPLPITLGGPTGPLAAHFQAAAAKAGKSLLIGPTAQRQQAPAGGTLKPGDAVAASTVTGDVTAGSVGTVTYVDGDRVWAFGHADNGTGASRLLMERAQITTVVASPTIGEQVTYKLGSPVAPVGTIGFDGAFAVGGVLGPQPGTIPVGATIKDGAGTVIGQAAANVVDERPVRGGNTGGLLPVAAAANAAAALQRLTTQAAVGGSARTCTTITLKQGNPPLRQCSDAVLPRPTAEGGVETGIADAAGGAVAGITGAERYLRLVDKVQVDVTYRNQADSLEIVRIKQPKTVKAGSTITIRIVVVQGSTGDRREIPVKVRVPRYAAGESTGIVALSTPVVSAEDAFEDLFAEEDAAAAVPKTLDAVRKGYTDEGISGLRVAVVPGLGGSSARELLTGDTEESDLSEDELAALTKRVKLVHELPTYVVEGAASTTVRPR